MFTVFNYSLSLQQIQYKRVILKLYRDHSTDLQSNLNDIRIVLRMHPMFLHSLKLASNAYHGTKVENAKIIIQMIIKTIF